MKRCWKSRSFVMKERKLASTLFRHGRLNERDRFLFADRTIKNTKSNSRLPRRMPERAILGNELRTIAISVSQEPREAMTRHV